MIYCPARLAITDALSLGDGLQVDPRPLLPLSQQLLLVQSVIDPVNYTIIHPMFYHFMHKVCAVWVLGLFALRSILQFLLYTAGRLTPAGCVSQARDSQQQAFGKM